MLPVLTIIMILCNIIISLLPYSVLGWSHSPIISSYLRGSSSTLRRCTHCFASFDFSSPSEWDTFYQQEKESNEDAIEWHSSIPLEKIASFVPEGSKCLVPGCGNSKLPQVILSQVPDVSITLLDSSQTCINQLKEEYGSSIADYHCGDATKLSDLFPFPTAQNNQDKFDIIIDKGLSDAILCGEGWNGPLERLCKEASAILKDETGQYLLISYRLPKSTQAFLQEVGQEVGLEWQFELPDSNNRVSVSRARKQRH